MSGINWSTGWIVALCICIAVLLLALHREGDKKTKDVVTEPGKYINSSILVDTKFAGLVILVDGEVWERVWDPKPDFLYVTQNPLGFYIYDNSIPLEDLLGFPPIQRWLRIADPADYKTDKENFYGLTVEDFPYHGKEGVLYYSVSDDALYEWDEEEMDYYQVVIPIPETEVGK